MLVPAPVLSIQKLAGHKNLQTTLRYMHLSPGETERAIRLLEGKEIEKRCWIWRNSGDGAKRGAVPKGCALSKERKLRIWSF